MASSFVDKTTLAQVIGTSFDTSSVRPLRSMYVFDAVCKEKQWNLNTNPNRGDAIQFVTLSAWSSNTGALSPTVATITGSQTLTHTRRSVTLELYGDHTVIDTLESRAETFVDEVADAAFSLADQASNSLNKIARSAMDLNKYANETSGTLSSTYHAYGSYGFGAGTAGPMKAKTVRDIVSRLRGANVQPFPDGYYLAIVHPIQYTQLRADSDNAAWTDSKKATETGLTDMLTGNAGIFEGVRFVMNNEVAGNASGTISSYFLGREFCGKAIGKDLRVATKSTMDGPHENLMTMFWDALVGYKIIRRDAGIICETTNTRL